MIEEVELFFATYKNTAWAFFSSVAFIWAMIKIGLSVYKAIANRANLAQRHKFQAGYFDTQEARYDKLLDKHDKLIDKYVTLEGKYNKILLHIVSNKNK